MPEQRDPKHDAAGSVPVGTVAVTRRPTPAATAFDRQEAKTLVPCAACGGEFRRELEGPTGVYRKVFCPWCTDGAMTDEQLQKWKANRVADR